MQSHRLIQSVLKRSPYSPQKRSPPPFILKSPVPSDPLGFGVESYFVLSFLRNQYTVISSAVNLTPSFPFGYILSGIWQGCPVILFVWWDYLMEMCQVARNTNLVGCWCCSVSAGNFLNRFAKAIWQYSRLCQCCCRVWFEVFLPPSGETTPY